MRRCDAASPLMACPCFSSPAASISYFEMVKLDDYYQDCVIGGTGAFIIPIRNVSEFVPAIRRKLILEIARRDLPSSRSRQLRRVAAPTA